MAFSSLEDEPATSSSWEAIPFLQTTASVPQPAKDSTSLERAHYLELFPVGGIPHPRAASPMGSCMKSQASTVHLLAESLLWVTQVSDDRDQS